MTSKNYIVIPNGLFKDSFPEEAVPLENKLASTRKTPSYTNLTIEDIENAMNTILLETPMTRPETTIHTSAEGHRQFQEALQGIIMYGTAGEALTDAEQMWADTRFENIEVTHNSVLDTEPYIQDRDNITITRNMTEQEIINYFDTISNEEQQTNTEH